MNNDQLEFLGLINERMRKYPDGPYAERLYLVLKEDDLLMKDFFMTFCGDEIEDAWLDENYDHSKQAVPVWLKIKGSDQKIHADIYVSEMTIEKEKETLLS